MAKTKAPAAQGGKDARREPAQRGAASGPGRASGQGANSAMRELQRRQEQNPRPGVGNAPPAGREPGRDNTPRAPRAPGPARRK
jgi:hypothetical protein